MSKAKLNSEELILKAANKVSLGEILRIIRIANDFTMEEMSECIGFSRSYISELENGKKLVSLKAISKYLSYFQINKVEFISILKLYERFDENDKLERYQRTLLKVLNILLHKPKE